MDKTILKRGVQLSVILTLIILIMLAIGSNIFRADLESNNNIEDNSSLLLAKPASAREVAQPTTTYTMTVQGNELNYTGTDIFTKPVELSSSSSFTEGSEPSFDEFIGQNLRNLAIQIYGEGYVKTQESLLNNPLLGSIAQKNAWWVNWEEKLVVNREGNTVTIQIPITIAGEASTRKVRYAGGILDPLIVTFTKQTTPKDKV